MAIHSGILAWKIPWAEEPGRLQSMASQRVGYDLAIEQKTRRKYLTYNTIKNTKHLKNIPKRDFQDGSGNKHV